MCRKLLVFCFKVLQCKLLGCSMHRFPLYWVLDLWGCSVSVF